MMNDACDETRLNKKTYPPPHLETKYRHALRLLAMGMSAVEVANETRLHRNTLNKLKHSEYGKAHLAKLMDKMDEAYILSGMAVHLDQNRNRCADGQSACG